MDAIWTRMAEAEESVRAEDAEQHHPGFRVRSPPQRDVQNGGVFVWLSGVSGECRGTGVSDGAECGNKYDVGRGGGSGREGKIGGGVQGVGGGADAASTKGQRVGFFPGLAQFDLQGVEKQMHVLVFKLDGIFGRMIGQRMKTEGGEGKRKERKDFMQFLLNLKEEDRDSKTLPTITHVKALLMDMVAWGTDTSSNIIEFAIAEMMHKPKVMKRVQEELEAVVRKDNMVEEFQIHKLSYLQVVMK
ncbi:Flavonoid 3',5'-hydroxylase [Spatholobus suberectus]|nr:Flavonoid 3',5'-hydroxylase [Spatholobus suberectus]